MKRKLTILLIILALLTGCDDCRTRARRECETITDSAAVCDEHVRRTCDAEVVP